MGLVPCLVKATALDKKIKDDLISKRDALVKKGMSEDTADRKVLADYAASLHDELNVVRKQSGLKPVKKPNFQKVVDEGAIRKKFEAEKAEADRVDAEKAKQKIESQAAKPAPKLPPVEPPTSGSGVVIPDKAKSILDKFKKKEQSKASQQEAQIPNFTKFIKDYTIVSF